MRLPHLVTLRDGGSAETQAMRLYLMVLKAERQAMRLNLMALKGYLQQRR